jgi:hypothetical protein
MTEFVLTTLWIFANCSPQLNLRHQGKTSMALLVSAAIIAAVRLAREPINNTPRGDGDSGRQRKTCPHDPAENRSRAVKIGLV